MNSQEDVDKLRSIPEPQTVMGNELRKPGVARGWGLTVKPTGLHMLDSFSGGSNSEKLGRT